MIWAAIHSVKNPVIVHYCLLHAASQPHAFPRHVIAIVVLKFKYRM